MIALWSLQQSTTPRYQRSRCGAKSCKLPKAPVAPPSLAAEFSGTNVRPQVVGPRNAFGCQNRLPLLKLDNGRRERKVAKDACVLRWHGLCLDSWDTGCS